MAALTQLIKKFFKKLSFSREIEYIAFQKSI